jgi:hypothetical protein
MRWPHLLLTVLAILALSRSASAADRREPLVDQVRKSADAGRDYLLRQQRDGNWEHVGIAGYPGGATALTLLALLNAGVPLDDVAIQRGLEYLRKIPPEKTYVVALQTMVFALTGKDRDRIERNVKWLLDARQLLTGKFSGWTYNNAKGGAAPDHSNMQYALLGLHEAQQAGVPIDANVWKEIREHYISTQLTEGESKGAWYYNATTPQPRITMTAAGLCGLIIAGMDLNVGREKFNNGRFENCGEYEESPAVKQALEWIGNNFSIARIEKEGHIYYSLYGLERAGRLTGQRYFGKLDWYREGCEYLVSKQNVDGAWSAGSEPALIATSFALLFLSKGRTPVLITKLPHDGGDDAARVFLPRDRARNDWNNDRNDARNLVEHASRELFKRKPMAWQVFNTPVGENDVDALAEELLGSPIVYFNGHLEPRFSDLEKKILRKYVENGGLIFAEACCGDKRFDEGFRKLMKDWFESSLEELPATHPIWTAAGRVVNPKRFPLYGIQLGCRTVLIYSPRDVSCWWESNLTNADGDARMAFDLGLNVIAYATGLEPPKDRGTRGDVLRDEPTARVRSGYLKVAQLRHGDDWKPAPQAMPTLMRELRQQKGLDVSLRTDELSPLSRSFHEHKFLYMHGRKTFTYNEKELAALAFNLENGGLLLADAACGAKDFEKSFRAMVADLCKVWGGKYKLEPIPLTDELYGKELNGTPISRVRCRREEGGKRDTAFKEYEPMLEGVKIDGAWAIVFSKYDIGCALEKTRSPDCLGHDYESAVRLASAVVLYALKH